MSLARTIIVLLTMAAATIAIAAPAAANFTSAQLAAISASPPPHAALPLALSFEDENGRPTTIGNAITGCRPW